MAAHPLSLDGLEKDQLLSIIYTLQAEISQLKSQIASLNSSPQNMDIVENESTITNVSKINPPLSPNEDL